MMTPTKTEDFEILPAGEMQEKYQLYAENRPSISLDTRKVPEKLRHLIPLAEKFGVGCDITRHDLGSKTSTQEKQNLSAALKDWHAYIAKWINDWDDPMTFPPEAYAFMQMCVFEMEESGGPGLPGKDETDLLAKLK